MSGFSGNWTMADAKSPQAWSVFLLGKIGGKLMCRRHIFRVFPLTFPFCKDDPFSRLSLAFTPISFLQVRKTFLWIQRLALDFPSTFP